MIQLIEGDWVQHGEKTIRFEKDSKFPISVDILGSKLEISGIEKTSLFYEVKSGFSEMDPILLK